jgi:hypothetical protein
MTRLLAALPVVLALQVASAFAAETVITIDADQSIGTVSPRFYGLMTEEINHSYDGGLYAELVQNRAFLDNETRPAHWLAVRGTGAAARNAPSLQKSRLSQRPVTSFPPADSLPSSAGTNLQVKSDLKLDHGWTCGPGPLTNLTTSSNRANFDVWSRQNN